MNIVNNFLANGSGEGFLGHCTGFLGRTGSGLFSGHMIGGLFMILFWALIILAVIWLVKSLSGENNSEDTKVKNDRKSSLTPEELARKRFARGEISQEEFEEIVSTLEEY